MAVEPQDLQDYFILSPDKKLSGAELAKEFERVACNWMVAEETPSPEQIANALIDSLGERFPTRSPLYNSIVKIAERAHENRNGGDGNEYHHWLHTVFVAIAAAHLAKHSNLHYDTKLAIIAAAFGHDIDHPGHGNQGDNKFENEERSANITAGMLEQEGVSRHIVSAVKAMIIGTSPNGGLQYVRALQSDRNAETPHQIFNRMYLENINEVMAILCDADVFASIGSTFNMLCIMTQQVADEMGAGKATYKNIVGFFEGLLSNNGFSSRIGRELSQEVFKGHLDHAQSQATDVPLPSAQNLRLSRPA